MLLVMFYARTGCTYTNKKHSVSRWSEQLVVYPRTNKQNQKKKRKVEPTTSQVVLVTVTLPQLDIISSFVVSLHLSVLYVGV